MFCEKFENLNRTIFCFVLHDDIAIYIMNYRNHHDTLSRMYSRFNKNLTIFDPIINNSKSN